MKLAKNYVLIVWVCLPVWTLLGQEVLSLRQCLTAARQHQPVQAQLAVIHDITERQIQQAGTSYLPAFQVSGQATYQTDVTSLPIRFPGVEIPTLSKDQYRLVGELQQVLWDGGISQSLKEVSKIHGDVQSNGVEQALYQVQSPVIQAFFGLLVNRRQQELTRTALDQINQRIKQADEALAGGVIIKSDWRLLRLKAMDLETIAQQLLSDEKILQEVLTTLTGISVEGQNLSIPTDITKEITSVEQRPDIQGFYLQRELLVQQSDLTRARNNPRFSVFGQVGYGKPGLNMLEDKFATFGLFGLRAAWNLSPYYTGTQKRDLEILQLQQKSIDLQRENALQNLTVQSLQQQKLIHNALTLVSSLEARLLLLQENTVASDHQWKQGMITTADYLDRWTEEQVARQNLELQKILINKYQTELSWLTGNLGQ